MKTGMQGCRFLLLTGILIFVLNAMPGWSQRSTLADTQGKTRALKYKDRFGVKCAQEKITDDKGNNYGYLHGTRNMRVVLHGAVYRGGANNIYHRLNTRPNKNPLQYEALVNLANEGFSEAVYLYAENFPGDTIISSAGLGNQMWYTQNLCMNDDDVYKVLKKVNEVIKTDTLGPVFLHCWNGWHQSGYISAIILRQFCEFSGDSAVVYWETCADQWNKGYDKIKAKIRAFEPYQELLIDKDMQNTICPCFEPHGKEIDKDSVLFNVRNMLFFQLDMDSCEKTLSPGVMTQLDQYSTFMKQNLYVNVEIVGYGEGRKKKKGLNAERNASLVSDYLLESGIDPVRIKKSISGKEESKAGIENGVTIKIESLNFKIHFPSGEYKIPDEDKAPIVVISEILTVNPDVSAKIIGHTDNVGIKEYNLHLSEVRAKSVYDYLVFLGADENRISYIGLGDQSPIGDNSTAEGRNMNRRIEITFSE